MESISTFWRYFGENRSGIPDDASPDFLRRAVGDFRSTQKWKRLSPTSTIIIPSMTRREPPKRSFDCSTGSGDRRRRQIRETATGADVADVPGDLHSGSVPGSPHTRRPGREASAMLDFRAWQLHPDYETTDDARVDQPMFALIFTN